jgi:hypothetical protein
MKIYLAGPMTGIPEHNYPTFHAAAARIRAKGHVCLNPAEVNPESSTKIGEAPTHREYWLTCMRRDIPQLLSCDAIALLPFWNKSKGARLEVHIASELGMPIILESDWQPLSAGVKKRLAIQELLTGPDGGPIPCVS